MKKIILLTLFIFTMSLNAAVKRSEHTYQLAKGETQPQATLKDASWLVGSWQGNAFGSQFEEVWNPASAGSMVGMFKVFNDENGVSFYELMLMVQENNSLSLLVKHFSSDFKAWEEKSEYVSFKLVKLEKNAIHFSGLSFYKDGPNKINGYIVLKQKDGSVNEEVISYLRR